MKKHNRSASCIPDSVVEEALEMIGRAFFNKHDTHDGDRRDAAQNLYTALLILNFEQRINNTMSTYEEPGFEIPALRIGYLLTQMLDSSTSYVLRIASEMLDREPKEQEAILLAMEAYTMESSSNPVVH